MAQITGGLVRYERSVKVAEYENKKFTCELSWAAPEGEDAVHMLDHAANMAVAETHYRLGLGKQGAATPAKEPPPLETNPKPEPQPPVEQPKSPTPPKERKEPKLGSVEALRDAAARAAEIVDPLLGAPVTVSPPSSTVTEDDFAALPPEISREDMLQACADKANEVGSIAVRKLVGEYAVQVSMIPEDRRADFMARLAELTK